HREACRRKDPCEDRDQRTAARLAFPAPGPRPSALSPSKAMSLTLYGLTRCDTCRKARNWLDRHGVAYEFVDYRDRPVDADTLKDWARQAGGWDKLVNRASTTWRNLPAARKAPGSDPEWRLLIREYPTL